MLGIKVCIPENQYTALIQARVLQRRVIETRACRSVFSALTCACAVPREVGCKFAPQTRKKKETTGNQQTTCLIDVQEVAIFLWMCENVCSLKCSSRILTTLF